MVKSVKGKVVTESVLKDAVDTILSGMDNLYDRMKEDFASKKDLEEVKERLGGVESTLNSLDRKFDAQQTRLDRHDKRITKLEEKANFVN